MDKKNKQKTLIAREYIIPFPLSEKDTKIQEDFLKVVDSVVEKYNMEKMEQPESFEKKLENLINEYSKENGSDTPDFLLAEYLSDCLYNYNKTIRARDKWFGIYDIWSWRKGEEAQYETQIRL